MAANHIIRWSYLALMACTLWVMSSGYSNEPTIKVKRTNNLSPEFMVPESAVDFLMNYTGYTYTNEARTAGRRFFEGEIGPRVLEMIDQAATHIILSVFLFDSFYSDEAPKRDVVKILTRALVDKRRTHPDIHIAVILDPSHRAYGRRESKSVREFREAGIDVFYSDLISGLKKASLLGVREGLGHAGRLVDTLTFRVPGKVVSGVFSKAPLPIEFDGDPVTLEAAYNGFLLKANHRKLLVTDTGNGAFEMMATSANPHNASAFHINSAITVKGEIAKYTFNVLREDMKKSADLGGNYVHWNLGADRAYRQNYFEQNFPELKVKVTRESTEIPLHPVYTQFVSEKFLPEKIIALINDARPSDKIRIQMFYLSFRPVLDAILNASEVVDQPIRILLDANKDSFNREKDGTPNRQVARFLLNQAAARGGKIEIRWYSTHGEQNHAKTMSITNADRNHYILTTGSCNWTGRNMDGVNMESNLVLRGAQKANGSFNQLFDLFWSNSDGNEYSLPYEAFRDQTRGDWKWRLGEKPFYYSTF